MLRPQLNGLLIRINYSNSNGQEIYFVDEGVARQYIPSGKFDDMFRGNAHVIDITFSHADLIDIGPGMNGLLLQYHGAYYVAEKNGKYRHVADPQTMTRCNFNPDAKASIIDPLDYPETLGTPIQWVPKDNGCRVKTRNNDAIYLIDQGKKRHIHDPETYISLFGGFDQARLVDSLDDIQTGVEIIKRTTGLIISNDRPGGPQIYLMDNGYKRMVLGTNTKASYGYGFGAGQIANVPWGQASEYPDGAEIIWPDQNLA